MATYNRRIVYLADTEWSALVELAREKGMTVSSYIRRELGFVPSEGLASYDGPVVTAGRMLAERAVDAENSLTDLGRAFNSRPFRPVPKK